MPTEVDASVLRVVVNAPLRRVFDYLPCAAKLAITRGTRVRVPFGPGQAVGLVLGSAEKSEIPRERLRPILEVLDPRPVLSSSELRFLEWVSEYYQHPVGEVVFAALPGLLRRSDAVATRELRLWRLTELGSRVRPEDLPRAPHQRSVLAMLQARPQGLEVSDFGAEARPLRAALRALVHKGWVNVESRPCGYARPAAVQPTAARLNAEQQQAAGRVLASLGQFRAFLLDGVTGSGKTEVYLELIERTLERGRQALVLVPEIGLTPQLVERFRHRLAGTLAVIHSGLSDRDRLCAWRGGRSGEAQVFIGTRSAIFTPLRSPGLFIVDEEHDGSFKQQEGFRYSARDLAVKRASEAGVPVVLGSATPSLETLRNVRLGRFGRLVLPRRAGSATPPEMLLLDLRGRPLHEGLAPALLEAIGQQLERGEQSLLFLNRRGYAPALLCHHCGWVAGCERCDSRMTMHRSTDRLLCHHCGAEGPIPKRCPDCGSGQVQALGQGTERVEAVLRRRFPAARLIRVDRDSTRRKGTLEAYLGQIRGGEADILIGTQMLAKGHHFPGVTLVGLLGVDHGLFSPDFRASERLAQLIVQVAGRAGRADRPGKVLIQTYAPEHPLLQSLVREGYGPFAVAALELRRQASLPPFSAHALLRAEASAREPPVRFLEQALEAGQRLGTAGACLLGPVPAPMERRAGHFRFQLLAQAERRGDLQAFLRRWVGRLDELPTGRRVRWSLDVDPIELF